MRYDYILFKVDKDIPVQLTFSIF